MKPVAIFRHTPTEGPAYFATYLERMKIPYRIVGIDVGEAVPADAAAFAGLCFMGGPMSVNDDLPWIASVCSLIRDAISRDVPVLGHCLGGQLMAKALGAPVTRNPVKEIGWGEVVAENVAAARPWSPVPAFPVFQWHGETFAIPPGATRIWGSAHCANQAFVLGPHLAMQCHVEMTADLIATWCESGSREIARNLERSPAVQPVAEIQRELEPRLAALHAVADHIYGRWTAGLRRD